MASIDNSSRSLGHPLSGLASDTSMLFRKEIGLAKTEASGKLDQAGGATRALAIGAVGGLGSRCTIDQQMCI